MQEAELSWSSLDSYVLSTGEDSETRGHVLELWPASVQQAWDLAQNFGYVAPTEHLSPVLKTILL